MFEVQAGEGSGCAGFFTAAGTSHRRSGSGWARWAGVSSAADNLCILLSLPENIDGQTQGGLSVRRMAGCSARSRFRRLPPKREKIQFAAAVADSRHSVKMIVGLFAGFQRVTGAYRPRVHCGGRDTEVCVSRMQSGPANPVMSGV
jgi:hypothetical protein